MVLDFERLLPSSICTDNPAACVMSFGADNGDNYSGGDLLSVI
jgi:hypothetical protein